jgi:hypothetical protein
MNRVPADSYSLQCKYCGKSDGDLGALSRFALVSAALGGDSAQIGTVAALVEAGGETQQGFGIDIAVAPSDLFEAGDLEPLAVLDGADELGGFEQGIVRAGVKPGVAAAKPLDRERAGLQIGAVEEQDPLFQIYEQETPSDKAIWTNSNKLLFQGFVPPRPKLYPSMNSKYGQSLTHLQLKSDNTFRLRYVSIS